jgi:hypothetical protein
MPDFKILNGSFVLSDGDAVIVTGRDALKQRLLIKFRTVLGEWFRDPTEGTDYKNAILGKPFSRSSIDREIRRVMVQMGDIQSILSITAIEDLVNQKALIKVKYRDKYGSDPQTLEATL